MSGSPFDASAAQQGAKRRSFPGGKDANPARNNTISMTASTSEPAASLFTSRPASWYSKVLRREGPLVGLLATGTGMVLLNQIIADQVCQACWVQDVLSAQSMCILAQDIADNSVQVLAWVKYGAIYFAACLAARTDPAKSNHTREQYILMAIIGLLDVFAYAANCLGVTLCGAAKAALILAGTQQVFTAVMSYFLLGRRLTPRHISGVSCHGTHTVTLAHAVALPHLANTKRKTSSDCCSGSSNSNACARLGIECVALKVYRILLLCGAADCPAVIAAWTSIQVWLVA